MHFKSGHDSTNLIFRATTYAGLAVDCSVSSLTWVEAIRPPLDETHSLSYLNKFINVNRVI